MGVLKDIVDFERHNLKEIGRKIKKDPKRLLLGLDQGSTKVWNTVLGRDDDAVVDFYGGPTGDVYDSARAAGIRTGPGKSMHGAARVIASLYAARGLGGIGGSPASGASSGLSSADKAVLYGDVGYGSGMSGAETGATSSANLAGNSGQWSRLIGQTLQNYADSQPAAHELPVDYVEFDDRDPYEHLVSSRRAKVGLRERGTLDLNDPIDRNGAEIAAIQELTRRIEAATKRLAALKRRKGKRHGD